MKASLFITCLADQFFPQIGRSVVTVLRQLGVEIDFPSGQTCCGQPAFNMGYWNEAREVASRMLHIFRDSEYVVAPSGSCISMVRIHFKDLFADDPRLLAEAESLSRRSYEFTEFLVHVLKTEDVGASFPHKVTYHDSCHLLRGLGIREESRRLIRAVRGIEFVEMNGSDVCCGFGGAFSIKFPEISTAMMNDKLRNIVATGAEFVVAGDAGCLMHLGGGSTRQELSFGTMHIAELLTQRE